MKKKFDEIETKAITINNSATNSNGISYIYNDRTDSNKLKIGRGTVPGNNVTLTINEEGKVGVGTTNPQVQLDVSGTGSFGQLGVSGNVGIGIDDPKVPLDISEMGGLVIAERYIHDTSDPASLGLTTTMSELLSDFSVTFVCPSNGKVKIQMMFYTFHQGITVTSCYSALHDGTNYVYDIDGVQLDQQQFYTDSPAGASSKTMHILEYIITKDGSNVSLVSGASYTFTARFEASISAEISIDYSSDAQPIIMKAMTVPSTIL